ncbi:MAG TPA: PilZ domain-containing protein [Stellaceae bacterium]|nr:PilZ domain-containing protein [Stellaceae bacterium]
MSRKRTRTGYDRLEFRRDRRYPVPPLIARIADRDYPCINWSLGGFLIEADDLGLGVGDGVAGSLHMPGTGKSCAFVAEAVWTERKGGVVGAKFTELAAAALELLDGYMAHWIKRSGR